MAGFDVVSFLTDYGWADGFVAACHGVILGIAPHVRIIDVSHLIPPGDVRRGAAVLAQTVPYLPPAVHLAVVDPGVGTNRRAIAAATPNGCCVGPDNGLFGWAARVLGGITGAVEITSAEVLRRPVSRTFHGRDVFAPAAAALALGRPLAALGPAVAPGSLLQLAEPRRSLSPGRIEAEVVTVDHFGNVQTAASAADVAACGLAAGGGMILVVHGGRHRVKYAETFGAVSVGQLVAYIDSAGLLALAVNGGDAAGRLRVRPGDLLVLTR